MADEIQPITPEAPFEPGVVTPEDDSNEWNDAIEEAYPEAKTEKPEEKDPESPTTEPAVNPDVPVEAPEQPTPVDDTARNIRIAQRQNSEEMVTIKSDIKNILYKDLETTLKDGDGDPINGVEDMMRLEDPRTGEPFTEEAAAVWLLNAQNQLKEQSSQAESYVEQVAQVNMAIKDDVDEVTAKYKKVIDANPELAKEVWEDYAKTLKMSPDGSVIIEAPISLASYYKRAFEPYSQINTAKEEAEAAKKEVETMKKARERSDRSDIYGGGKVDNMSKDQKEWAEAAEEYYK